MYESAGATVSRSGTSFLDRWPRLSKINQFHLKNKRSVGGNGAGAVRTIPQHGWNKERAFTASFQKPDTFLPAFDYSVEGEGCRFGPLRLVKYLFVFKQFARIPDFNGTGEAWVSARTRFRNDIVQAGGGRFSRQVVIGQIFFDFFNVCLKLLFSRQALITGKKEAATNGKK